MLQIEYKSAQKRKSIWQRLLRVVGRQTLEGPVQTSGSMLGWSVVILAAMTLVIGVWVFFSPRFALILAAVLVLAGLIIFEMLSRRRWESAVNDRLLRVDQEYARLVRDVARNRNDLAVVRQKLADAGSEALRESRVDPAGVAILSMLTRKLSELAEPVIEKPLRPVAAGVEVPLHDESGRPLNEEEIARRLSDAEVLQLVHAAVEQDAIDLFLQPVVSLPQRKIRFYEMLSRIRIGNGLYLGAGRYVRLAAAQEILPVIDNLLLLRGLQILRQGEAGAAAQAACFCNIGALTLNDPKFMGDLVEFLAHNRAMAARLVFELAQRDLAMMGKDVLPILDGLSHLGCRFSMDQVRGLSFDLDHLHARHIRFVKVPAQMMLSALSERGGLSRMRKLKADFDLNGIDLIVERIETESQLLDLLDLEVDYGQGYLFGRPALAGESV